MPPRDWTLRVQDILEAIGRISEYTKGMAIADFVADGTETRRVLRVCGKAGYQKALGKELAEMGNSEMWRAGAATRSLRPKDKPKKVTRATKGVAGRKSN